MRSKSLILLVLALGCGLVASIGISQVMDARNKAPVDDGEKQAVFVALTDIKPNEELNAQNIKLEEWPKRLVPAGALTKLDEVEGKRARLKLYAGETILANKLINPGEALGAASQIPPGYRVAHVKVDSITGSNNLILPGDRVDVLVYRTTSDLNATAARVVLQDVRVFAVDTHTENDARAKGETNEPITARTISLLVTLEQANLLHIASEISGSIRLVLRNPDDDVHVNVPSATIGDIFGPELKTNRQAEQLGQQETPPPDNWIEPQTKTADPDPILHFAPSKKMVVILGAEATTVEIPSNGDLPIMPKYDGSSSGGSSPFSTGSQPSPPDGPYLPDDQDMDSN